MRNAHQNDLYNLLVFSVSRDAMAASLNESEAAAAVSYVHPNH